MLSKITRYGITLLAIAFLSGCIRTPVKLSPAKPEVRKVILVDLTTEVHRSPKLS